MAEAARTEHGHRKADTRNFALHRAALQKLQEQPDLRRPCLELVERWLGQQEQAPSKRWLQQWRDMLTDWTDEEMAEVVLDEEAGQSLRQCSPLGPTLTPQERWRLLADIESSLK